MLVAIGHELEDLSSAVKKSKIFFDTSLHYDHQIEFSGFLMEIDEFVAQIRHYIYVQYEKQTVVQGFVLSVISEQTNPWWLF